MILCVRPNQLKFAWSTQQNNISCNSSNDLSTEVFFNCTEKRNRGNGRKPLSFRSIHLPNLCLALVILCLIFWVMVLTEDFTFIVDADTFIFVTPELFRTARWALFVLIRPSFNLLSQSWNVAWITTVTHKALNSAITKRKKKFLKCFSFFRIQNRLVKDFCTFYEIFNEMTD